MIRVRCPICGRLMERSSAAAWPQYPFCCERCRLIDLGRWLGENYRLPPMTEGEVPADDRDDSEIP